MSSSPRYTFRPATEHDLPLLRAWLSTPEVGRWWGDPAEQEALLRADLDEPMMVMLIVSFDGRPFAYAQHCPIDGWPQTHLSWLPLRSRAIDAFIGEPDMLGRGHGSAFVRLLAEQLRADGAPTVVIDPDVENVRARRAYARAGFVGEDVVESDDGPVVLMTFGE